MRVERSVPDSDLSGNPIGNDPGNAGGSGRDVDSTARPRPAQTPPPRRPSQDSRPRVVRTFFCNWEVYYVFVSDQVIEKRKD